MSSYRVHRKGFSGANGRANVLHQIISRPVSGLGYTSLHQLPKGCILKPAKRGQRTHYWCNTLLSVKVLQSLATQTCDFKVGRVHLKGLLALARNRPKERRTCDYQVKVTIERDILPKLLTIIVAKNLLPEGEPKHVSFIKGLCCQILFLLLDKNKGKARELVAQDHLLLHVCIQQMSQKWGRHHAYWVVTLLIACLPSPSLDLASVPNLRETLLTCDPPVAAGLSAILNQVLVHAGSNFRRRNIAFVRSLSNLEDKLLQVRAGPQTSIVQAEDPNVLYLVGRVSWPSWVNMNVRLTLTIIHLMAGHNDHTFLLGALMLKAMKDVLRKLYRISF